jgi:hypothetical protein
MNSVQQLGGKGRINVAEFLTKYGCEFETRRREEIR